MYTEATSQDPLPSLQRSERQLAKLCSWVVSMSDSVGLEVRLKMKEDNGRHDTRDERVLLLLSLCVSRSVSSTYT